MASLYGHIEEYNEEEEWTQYVERLEHYFVANEVEEAAKKRAILLTVCGQKTYKLIRSLVMPSKPGEKAYQELVTLVETYQNPKPSPIMQRYKFNTCFRKPGESVAQYVAELRTLSEHCNFGTTLDDMLRDRLVCAINMESVQRRLLAEKELTFEKALSMAQAMEKAVRDTKDLHTVPLTNTQGREVKVNKLFKKKDKTTPANNPSKTSSECYRCGGKHEANKCKFKDAECHWCHKKGHVIKQCRLKKQAMQESGKTGKSESTQSNFLGVTDDFSEKEYDMFTLNDRTDSSAFCVNLHINKAEVSFEIDTGAAVTVMSEKAFKTQNIDKMERLQESKVKLRTYTGDQVLGTIDVEVEYENQSKSLPLLIVAGEGPTLLGRNWLSKVRLNWQNLFKVTQDNPSDVKLQEILNKYGELFKEEKGAFTGPKAKIYANKDARPRYVKPRPVPYSMLKLVEDELESERRNH